MSTLFFSGGVANLEREGHIATIRFSHKIGETNSNCVPYEISFDMKNASEGYLERRGAMPEWLNDLDLEALILEVSTSAIH